ncbi:hypothetical protein Ciccas_007374 [Cichlidogyrus casuarinus]|uniref:Uncharacterized protein n=1 Tax=Cichlidogyrus casuarinus TaxID=1844966 RepID=A0ABD2Q4F9_9PLAT
MYCIADSLGLVSIYDTNNYCLKIHENRSKLVYPRLCQLNEFQNKHIACIQWYPVDSGLFALALKNKDLHLVDVNELRSCEVVPIEQGINWIAWSERAVSHNLVAVALSSKGKGAMFLIDPLIGAPSLTLDAYHSHLGVSTCLWSDNKSSLLFSGGFDGRVLCWDIRKPRKPLHSFDRHRSNHDVGFYEENYAHSGSVLSMKLSSDGQRLFTWGGAGSRTIGSLKMWSTDCGTDEDFMPVSVNFGIVNGLSNTAPIESSNPRSRDRNFTLTQEDVDLDSFDINPSNLRRNTIVPRSVRMDTTESKRNEPFDVAFVPAGKGLFSITSGLKDLDWRIEKRHHDSTTACAWNDVKKELYTCSLDGNLFVWPLFPLSELQ